MATSDIISQINLAVRRAPLLAVLLAISCVFGAWQSFAANAGEWDSPLALLFLAIGTSVHSLIFLPRKEKENLLLSWFLLGAGIFLMGWSGFCGSEFGKNSALMLGASGIAVMLHGGRCLKRLLLPLIICFLGLPFLENITLFLSYPLRLISTELTVTTLQLFGLEISSQLTTIYIGETQMAITDACSGVSQLGVLLFFAWILALKLPDMGRGGRIVWNIFTLPIIIVANTIRLLLTVGLFLMLGDRALQNDIHIALGYFFIFLSLLMLWGCGKVICGEKKE